ncbi:hypothetical protein GCM10010388_29890 [Streptomyces mauvecolor]
MTSHIKRLVQQLDGESGESYDARAELIHIGSAATRAILDALPSLGGFGQLTAIEVFEEVADPRCGPALITMLDSDNPTVRQWAATALASLDIEDAVEPLRRAYRACLERQTPPDESEPVAIRWALTDLGARSPVVPSLTARASGLWLRGQTPLVLAIDQRSLVPQQLGLGVQHPLPDLDAARPLPDVAPVADGALGRAVALGDLGNGQISHAFPFN